VYWKDWLKGTIAALALMAIGGGAVAGFGFMAMLLSLHWSEMGIGVILFAVLEAIIGSILIAKRDVENNGGWLFLLLFFTWLTIVFTSLMPVIESRQLAAVLAMLGVCLNAYIVVRLARFD